MSQQQSCNLAVVFVLLVLAIAVFFLMQRCRSLERRYEQVHIQLQSTVSQEFLKTAMAHMARPEPVTAPAVDPFDPNAFSCTDIGEGDAGVASAVLLVEMNCQDGACPDGGCPVDDSQWNAECHSSPKVVDITDRPVEPVEPAEAVQPAEPSLSDPATRMHSADWAELEAEVGAVDPEQLAEIEAGLAELASMPHPGFQASMLAAQEAERISQAQTEADLLLAQQQHSLAHDARATEASETRATEPETTEPEATETLATAVDAGQSPNLRRRSGRRGR